VRNNSAKQYSYVASFVLLLVLIGAPPSQADTVYTNFGTSMGFDTSFPGNGYIVGGGAHISQAVAEQFVAGGNFNVTDAQLPLELQNVAQGGLSGTTPPSVFLETNSGGLPGAVIGAFTLSGTIGGTPGSIVTYNCTTCPLLTSGSSYWLVVVESDPNNTFAAWDFTNSGALSTSGNLAFNPFNTIGTAAGPWALDPGGNPLSAFQIDGTAAPVPEPSTLLLLGFGLGSLALRSRGARRGAK
jgi:hypothetical protein